MNGGHVSPSTTFEYGQCLISSTFSEDRELGVALLTELLKADEKNRDYLYFIALGHYKSQDYVQARKYADQLLALEPNNRQAMSLKSLAEEKVAKDGLIGMMIVGGAAAAIVSNACSKHPFC